MGKTGLVLCTKKAEMWSALLWRECVPTSSSARTHRVRRRREALHPLWDAFTKRLGSPEKGRLTLGPGPSSRWSNNGNVCRPFGTSTSWRDLLGKLERLAEWLRIDSWLFLFKLIRDSSSGSTRRRCAPKNWTTVIDVAGPTMRRISIRAETSLGARWQWPNPL